MRAVDSWNCQLSRTDIRCRKVQVWGPRVVGPHAHTEFSPAPPPWAYLSNTTTSFHTSNPSCRHCQSCLSIEQTIVKLPPSYLSRPSPSSTFTTTSPTSLSWKFHVRHRVARWVSAHNTSKWFWAACLTSRLGPSRSFRWGLTTCHI